jgi:hypothetical protein
MFHLGAIDRPSREVAYFLKEELISQADLIEDILVSYLWAACRSALDPYTPV